MPQLEDLDEVYFAKQPWQTRLDTWLKGDPDDRPFVRANSEAVASIAQRADLGLRMGVNIPACALQSFLRDGRYKNAYERQAEAGPGGPPSNTRVTVDGALFPAPSRPRDYYFGAAVLAGAGVRYYGEYCLVLDTKSGPIPPDTQVIDRNSYDIVFPPLAGRAKPAEIAARLRGTWGGDLLPMVKLKVLPALDRERRLSTAGTASELLLHDESFVEVHKRGAFGPGNVHEVRETAADAAVEADLASRSLRGYGLTVEETIWLTRRREVDDELAAAGLRTRIVVTSGRVRS
jgi:hypothetical protein